MSHAHAWSANQTTFLQTTYIFVSYSLLHYLSHVINVGYILHPRPVSAAPRLGAVVRTLQIPLRQCSLACKASSFVKEDNYYAKRSRRDDNDLNRLVNEKIKYYYEW